MDKLSLVFIAHAFHTCVQYAQTHNYVWISQSSGTKYASKVGFEPATLCLQAKCFTNCELPGHWIRSIVIWSFGILSRSIRLCPGLLRFRTHEIISQCRDQTENVQLGSNSARTRDIQPASQMLYEPSYLGNDTKCRNLDP